MIGLAGLVVVVFFCGKGKCNEKEKQHLEDLITMLKDEQANTRRMFELMISQQHSRGGFIQNHSHGTIVQQIPPGHNQQRSQGRFTGQQQSQGRFTGQQQSQGRFTGLQQGNGGSIRNHSGGAVVQQVLLGRNQHQMSTLVANRLPPTPQTGKPSTLPAAMLAAQLGGPPLVPSAAQKPNRSSVPGHFFDR